MTPQLDEQTLPPAVQVSRMMLSQWMSEAIRAAVELGIGDALVEGPKCAGELAEELLFMSQRVQPAAAQASGYTFRFPDLEPALRHVLNRP